MYKYQLHVCHTYTLYMYNVHSVAVSSVYVIPTHIHVHVYSLVPHDHADSCDVKQWVWVSLEVSFTFT